MNIIWFSWKDRWHPEAGGAETVSGEIMDRLVRDGHTVHLITAHYPKSLPLEVKNGITIIRAGGRFSVYFKARNAYRNHVAPPCDVIIDEMNTIPFFASAYVVAKKKILLSYQLARKVWFYQMLFPFSVIGYLIEPLMLRILGHYYPQTLTESISSKHDMERFGLKKIQTFRIGMDLAPVSELPSKLRPKVLLCLGAIRPMKRTLHAIKAFEIARDKDPSLRLVLAGDASTAYAQKVLRYIAQSRHSEAIDAKGRVSLDEKLNLMRNAAVILVTSVKEGWGLIVTEANSQGTPAIVYDVDGLRDSVRSQETGIVSNNGDVVMMGNAITELLADNEKYQTLRVAAWEWSKEFTFDNSYRDFKRLL